MFWCGILIGICIGFILALIGQRGIEKNSIENGYVKLDGILFKIIPFKEVK